MAGPLTLDGTAGGQDSMRRAAMQYMGGGSAPTPSTGASPAAAATPQADVAKLLADATQLTLASPDRHAAIAAWRQALMLLGEQLKAVRANQPSPAMGQPPGPSAFSQMGAQAVSPNVGRFPR